MSLAQWSLSRFGRPARNCRPYLLWCSRARCTARFRVSGEWLSAFLIARTFRRKEPPEKTGRFREKSPWSRPSTDSRRSGSRAYYQGHDLGDHPASTGCRVP